MKKLTALLLACILTFSITALSSCATSIPSMYRNVNAPQPQLNGKNEYSGEQFEMMEQASDDYSALTGNVSVSTGSASNTNVSKDHVNTPSMYSSYIRPSRPSSSPSSSSSRPSSTPSSSTLPPSSSSSQVDPVDVPTTDSDGIEVILNDDLYNTFVSLLNKSYNITGNFEYDSPTKDVPMSMIVTLCEDKLRTDPVTDEQYFPKSVIEDAYKDFFGTDFTYHSGLTNMSGVKYSGGRYVLVKMPEKSSHVKYIRAVKSLNNGYYKITADIRVNGQVVANAVYVVRQNSSSPYGANFIAQKITQRS